MTLPASGPISFNDINVELGVSGTTQASMGQTSFRTLAGVASGQISMSNFYGKSNAFAFTISSNQTNANLRTLAVNAGWNQSTKVIATVGSGVYISSNSTGTPALTVNGSFPGGVELVNSGTIVGMGGAGGAGSTYLIPQGNQPGSPGYSGGTALSVSVAVTITNNGTVAGGGGGGGGGGESVFTYGKSGQWIGGGGGGGGRTGLTNSAAGSAPYSAYHANGYAGYAGTLSAAGAGGPGRFISSYGTGTTGGSGGGWGAAGSAGPSAVSSGGSGGAGGGAVTGNSNITWIATGTRLGSIT